MFEMLAVIGSVLLSLTMLFQFRRTYIERKTLKDLSFASFLTCFLASIFLCIRFVEIGEWAMFGMEFLCGAIDIITLYWIIQSSD